LISGKTTNYHPGFSISREEQFYNITVLMMYNGAYGAS